MTYIVLKAPLNSNQPTLCVCVCVSVCVASLPEATWASRRAEIPRQVDREDWQLYCGRTDSSWMVYQGRWSCYGVHLMCNLPIARYWVLWCQKTRVTGLSYGVIYMILYLAVDSTPTCDRQTDKKYIVLMELSHRLCCCCHYPCRWQCGGMAFTFVCLWFCVGFSAWYLKNQCS